MKISFVLLASFFVQVTCLVSAALAQNDVVISEFMADNRRTLLDQDGDYSDWIEIYNPTLSAVNLLGYHLTDDPARLSKWTFPATNLPSGGFLLVFASGKDRSIAGGQLHANFQLDAVGEFLALVKPDGTTVVSGFTPTFPAQKEDVAYGTAQASVSIPLLISSVPQLLVPASASDLDPNWMQPGFNPGAGWFAGSAPLAIGFDTNQPGTTAQNVAAGGVAVQSTTGSGATANLAIDGNFANATQTLSTDNSPFWQVTLAAEAAVYRVVLRNRTGCCQSRLRDITIQVLSANGTITNYSSALLNPENAGSVYPAGPATLQVDLEASAGGAVLGRVVRVLRQLDPDLSGSGGQGGVDEAAVLSLGEVEVFAVPVGTEVNLARTGNPAPTASQSSTNTTFTPNLALNGNLTDFTHTLGTDPNPTWTVDLGRQAVINSVVIHNRDSCCGSRLRDITVQILGPDGTTVAYTSSLLNPENAGFAFPNGPDNLNLNLNGQPVSGRFVRIRRTPDPDLSGTGGQGNTDEGTVLALGEVIVLGTDITGYRPFIRTDLQTRMLGHNASAFARASFNAANPSSFVDLSLRVRYDDGFVAFLNGVKIVERNAPGVLSWNSAATVDRSLGNGIVPEQINLASAGQYLVAGTNVLAFQGLNSSAGDSSFLLQPELTAIAVNTSTAAYLVDATPGTRNDTGFYTGEVADTQFSVDRGFFTAPFQLQITSETPDAQIYYSFNGAEPDASKGILYSGPLTITNTTILRARAFKAGLKATAVDTHTYVFLKDVLRQAPNGQAPPYFPATWGANAVDYGMDPNVVGLYTDEQWQEAFTQIPSMSIVTEMGNLFDPATGIYANALQHGIDWERPGSIELLDPHGAPVGRFQQNCGLRIRGGFSRNTDFVKHSLRIFFRQAYGKAKLTYPLFENEGAQEFDTFDLRTSQNYSWPRESDYTQGRQDTMVREVFCRETLGAMGQPYTRSRYYHLYLNGQYWGLYETQERAEASFGETYLGGKKEDYDVVKSGNHILNFVTEATDGNLTAFSNLWTKARALPANPNNANYFSILGRNADGTRDPTRPVLVDVDNLIDYMLEIFYSGDGDAPLSSFLSNNQANNWFAMRNRVDLDMGFHFFNQDSEHTLGSPSSQVDRTGPFAGSNQNDFRYANPQWIHQDLAANEEYRVRFGDHVQRHFFNGGALTAQAGTNRFLARAAQINRAIRPYSARWGDTKREPPYGETEWTNIIAEIVRNWFPPRNDIVLAQLRGDNLYPSIGAPRFNQHGGEIAEGFNLTLSHTNTSGIIYFTVDGTDPRLVGGALNPDAAAYTNGVTLTVSTRVKARVRIGALWSALLEADFAISSIVPLRVTELMYHPAAVTDAERTAGFTDPDDFEYIELRNVGTLPINLAGISFVNGISFTFPSGSLAAGARLVLVKNSNAFNLRYGTNATIAGSYGGNLNNGGERLRLVDNVGRTILDFSYSDGWFPISDGFGFSLVIGNDAAFPGVWDTKAGWRFSSALGGSPGAANPAAVIFPTVVINEVLSRPSGGPVSVELANLGATQADLSNWWLTDQLDRPAKYRLAPNTIIPAGGFLVLTEADFGGASLGTNALNLQSAGAEIRLFSADVSGQLTGYLQGWDFGAANPGVSFGRYVTSTGSDHFVAQTTATLGATNSGPRIGSVVISEVMYRPAPASQTPEFIELVNRSAAAVALFDANASSNTWRISGGIDFIFPTNLTLAAGEILLLVDFDPALDPSALATFRNRYSIPGGVRVLGPFNGQLDNSSDAVELKSSTLLSNAQPAFVLGERVSYEDSAPWPLSADGFGLSLQRLGLANYANDPTQWTAAFPTPGRALNLTGTLPAISAHPQGQIVPTGQSIDLAVTATGTAALRYQWQVNGDGIPDATNAMLHLTSAQVGQSGLYRVVVYNSAGAVVSEAAPVLVLSPPLILGHPSGLSVGPGTNVSFSVQAASSRPLRYQWRFRGVNLLNETNVTLTLSNVVFGIHDGPYTVAVIDEGGTSISQSALLVILVRPVIVQAPLAVSVPRGATAYFSVSSYGTLPMGYRWRKGGTTVKSEVTASTNSFFTITNVQSTDAGSYSVVLTNAAFSAPGLLSSPVTLTVIVDTDGDGIPDDFETSNNLNPNDPADALLDPDGDGYSNRQEYQAGTDRLDGQSYLKVLVRWQGGVQLQFQAAAQRTYTVLYQETLGGAWLPFTHLPAKSTSRLETIIDPNPSAERRYYRLVTPAQP